ncbi:MAG TPA: hypothetical protein VHF51_11460 [Solirubrobacteraceae bacterium]|nr:hypothetical protein [Solirubrobacteraceae bacterium]
MPALRLRTLITLIAACLAGAVSAAAVASGGPPAMQTTDTTGETTDTTTTGTTTTGTTTTGTTTTGTTTTPRTTAPRSPRIAEIEVDSVSGGRLRLRAEIVRRGARITAVRFTYRGRRYVARRRAGELWSRVVTARGGDSSGDVVTFRVTACAGSRCSTRTGSDEAGGGRRGGRRQR